ncbi:MAG: hypothetical protein P9M13_00270 [Candidatus Ancaeobacter aquaticus]|nr:hypothetical protein [Candidatus Ancaeobacter aquaticus]
MYCKVIGMAFIILSLCVTVHADIELTSGEQDGFVNEKEYNRNGRTVLVGKRDFVGVFEFHLTQKIPVKKATLVLTVSTVKVPGEFIVYHLLSFNNGRAEVQDYFSPGDVVKKIYVDSPKTVRIDVTREVNQDIQGPGEFTSYKVATESNGEILFQGFDSGVDYAKIETIP